MKRTFLTFSILLVIAATAFAQSSARYRITDVQGLDSIITRVDSLQLLRVPYADSNAVFTTPYYVSTHAAGGGGDTMTFYRPLVVSGAGSRDTISIDTSGTSPIGTKTWVASYVATTISSGGGGNVFADVKGDTMLVLTGDMTSLTNTLTAVPGFAVPLQANGVYAFRGSAPIYIDSTGISAQIELYLGGASPTSFELDGQITDQYAAHSTVSFDTSITTPLWYTMNSGTARMSFGGFIDVGATAHTLTLEFAQLYSNPRQAAILIKGARLYIRRIK